MLNNMMLRRTYGDKLMGEALVKLPRTSAATHRVVFNPIERFVYDIVHKRIQENISNMAQKGTLHQLTYHHVLTMVLRLRQAASHLFLVEQSMRDLLTTGDMNEIRRLCLTHERSVDQRDRDSLIALRQVLKNQEMWKAGTDEKEEALMKDIRAGGSKDLKTKTTGEAYGLQFNFMAYLDNLRAGSRLEELRETLRCGKCGADPVRKPVLTDCSHIYCLPCINEMAIEATSQGFPCLCKVCHSAYTATTEFDPDYTRESQRAQAAEQGVEDGEGKKGKLKKVSKKKKGIPLLLEKSDTLPLPSAKTIAVKAQMLNWIEENPRVKVIVFTQFLPIIAILEKMCDAEGWPCKGFYGGLSMEERDSIVKGFARAEGPSMLVATLRTGGVGLNLTMASKVIIMGKLQPFFSFCNNLIFPLQLLMLKFRPLVEF
jgi:SNF2 family DNA or RNA helicase